MLGTHILGNVIDPLKKEAVTDICIRECKAATASAYVPAATAVDAAAAAAASATVAAAAAADDDDDEEEEEEQEEKEEEWEVKTIFEW